MLAIESNDSGSIVSMSNDILHVLVYNAEVYMTLCIDLFLCCAS